MKALVLVLLLTGCTTIPKEVRVPVPVKCQAAEPAVPDWNAPAAVGGSIFDQMRALLADRVLATAYEAELVTALRSCK